MISTAFATPLAVRISDASNNGITGLPVVFTAPGSGASGTFGGSSTATVNTGANGVATAPALTANAATGAFVVTAANGGLSASFNLTNIFNPGGDNPDRVGDNQSVDIGANFQNPLVLGQR